MTISGTNNDKAGLVRLTVASTLAGMLALQALPSMAAETSRFSDEPIPMKSEEEFQPRTPPLIELGDPFLGTGNLAPGYELPTGAVWQPRFWVYGNLRGALQAYDQGAPGGSGVSEAAVRLDLFGNLQLTGTERILIGVQPFHEDGQFTRVTFKPDSRDGGDDHSNLRIRTLFFEGDLAELFPRWDYFDATQNDIGFSVGRQSMSFQNGFIINDTIDAVGLTRNNLRFEGVPWLINWRTTAVYGWDEIHRNNNRDDNQAHLFGLFTQLDTIPSTFNIDAIYVESEDNTGGDLLVGGFDAIQRIGKITTTFRVGASWAPDERTAAADDGVLLFTELSYTPAYTDNIAYLNAFAGFENYSSASRDPTAGGPLGSTGILFAARGIGTFPSPLSNRAREAYGAAAGYQMFLGGVRRQLIVEFGGRIDDSPGGFDAAGFAARFQQAIGARYLWQLDGFVTGQEDRDTGIGLRTELQIKF